MNGWKPGEGPTVLGRGTTFRGELTATEEVLIEGSVEGLIKAEGQRLTIGKDARVRADLVAQEIIVMGKVYGNLRAIERVELRSGATVTGDVFAKRFAMEDGSEFRGKVDPARAGEPAAALAPAQPVLVQPVAEPESFGLFGGGQTRQPGKMPAGLAAAARSFSSAEPPAGMNALAESHEAASEELAFEPEA